MPKIILFEKDNFSGKSLTITADEPNLESRKFNDKVSSIIVRGGVWTLYEHINYSGSQWEVSSSGGVDADGTFRSHTEWHGENDKISSLKLKSQA
jgi:hypothetical protein